MKPILQAVALGLLIALIMSASVLVPNPISYDIPLWRLSRTIDHIEHPAVMYEPAKGNEFYWQAKQLEHIITDQLGFQVVYVAVVPIPGAYAASNWGTREITIDEKIEWNGRLQALAHEGGHMLSPKTAMDHAGREVFAETVSYLVCRRYGFDSRIIAASYMTFYLTGWPVTDYYRRDIMWAVDVLTGPK